MRRPASKRALSLIEVIVTIGLLALVLQVAAALLRDVTRTSEHQRAREGLTSGLLALERIKAEALEALIIHSPDSPSHSELLDFEKLSRNADRLPPTPEPWTLRDPNHLTRVRYQLRGESLQRVETSANGASRSYTVVEEIDSFLVSRPSDDTLAFRFSFRVGERLHSFNIRVLRYLP